MKSPSPKCISEPPSLFDTMRAYSWLKYKDKAVTISFDKAVTPIVATTGKKLHKTHWVEGKIQSIDKNNTVRILLHVMDDKGNSEKGFIHTPARNIVACFGPHNVNVWSRYASSGDNGI